MQLLITPHGDLKPRAGQMEATIVHAHYPSWGFETSSSKKASRALPGSLPLMGI